MPPHTESLPEASADLPSRCDVIVVGAGPAGSACASVLARAGRDVLLVDAQVFPRDKTCGDGLIPDAFAALKELGLQDTVQAAMNAASHAYCQGPQGGALRVPGQLGVLRRRDFDHILLADAGRHGARLAMPWQLKGVLEDAPGGRVNGVCLRQGALEQTVHAKWVVLATGAALEPLLLSGLCTRRTPSSMALRGHVRLEGLGISEQEMRFIWHPALSPGYGWIFPMGDGLYNVGVGIDGLHQARSGVGAAKRGDLNLRTLFQRFCEVDPVARLLHEQGQWEGPLKGAPMRCDLNGAHWGRPGLLLAGEAAGSTYAFTGEGIGKALETGMATARAILTSQDHDAHVLAAHRQSLLDLMPRYRLYRKASHFNRWPWMIDLAIWRAQRSPRIIGLMGDVLAERRMPDSLLSWRGIKRMILG